MAKSRLAELTKSHAPCIMNWPSSMLFSDQLQTIEKLRVEYDWNPFGEEIVEGLLRLNWRLDTTRSSALSPGSWPLSDPRHPNRPASTNSIPGILLPRSLAEQGGLTLERSWLRDRLKKTSHKQLMLLKGTSERRSPVRELGNRCFVLGPVAQRLGAISTTPSHNDDQLDVFLTRVESGFTPYAHNIASPQGSVVPAADSKPFQQLDQRNQIFEDSRSINETSWLFALLHGCKMSR